MDVSASAGEFDPPWLAEAPKLVCLVSQAIQCLAAQIQSGDGPKRCWWKVAGPELELLKTHMLKLRFISAGPGYKELALEARDAAYLIDDLKDTILKCCKLHSKLARRASRQFKLLPALSYCLNRLRGLLTQKPPSKIMGDIQVVNEETRRIGHLLQKGAGTSPPLPPPRESATEILQAKAKVFGRDKDRDDIVQMLIQPCSKAAAAAPDTTVSIVGYGGIGKTTLAQMVFDDAQIRQHFDVRCWVSVSASFNLMKLTAEILSSAQPSWDGVTEKMVDDQMLQSELRRFLTSKRYLIVLDDVRNSTDDVWLDMLATLQSADIGSRILVTSRTDTVPRTLGTSQLHTLKPLNSDDCWALLKEHAFPSDTEDVRPELQPIGKQIAAKINGSPLAAKLVGGLLRDTRSENQWLNVMEKGLQDNGVSTVLQLSYRCLPVHLKRCFTYFSLFPPGYKFDPVHLSRLWIAEGFVQQQGSAEKRIEEIAREYFDQLVSRSLFQEIKLGPKTYYLVQGLLHDLAKSVAAEDCSHIEDGINCDIPLTVRHLSVTVNSLPGLTNFCGLEKVRTLLIQPSLPFSSSCFQEDFAVKLKCLLEKSKHLRVLDLSGCILEELPQCIDDLLHLRYLSIHGSIQRLPESIGKLLNLQTLCFTGKCSLDKLPASICMLVNLRHLVVETKYTAGLMGIGQLANLQGSLELHVEKREGHKVAELRKINGLHGVLKIKNLENVLSYEEACKAELDKKSCLSCLYLEWSSASRNNPPPTDPKVLEGLQPHQGIKVLTIRRYCGTKTPRWLQSLHQMRSLHLTNCRSLAMLPPLGHLGSLRYLHLKELCAVDRIGHEFYGTSHVAFPSLRFLEFDDFPRLHDWSGIEDKKSFPCLERLVIMDCPELVEIPPFLPITREVTIERTRFMPYMRLAPFSSSSEKLQLDVFTVSVDFNRLLSKQHIEAIAALNISGAEEVIATEEIGSLVSLQKMKLCRCNVADQNFTSGTFRFCTMLIELSVRNCQLFQSMSSFQSFNSLKYLVIERCPKVTATSFPLNFRSLSSLKVLRISYCSELQSLPECGLPLSLETLHIIGCHPELSRQSRNRDGHYVEKLGMVPSILIQ
ncbi:unnamed protein product [Alopecurus aequalis]